MSEYDFSNTLDLVLEILAMAGVTYLIRMFPLTLFKKKITNQYILSFLYYVPYAVLTAMTFPAILTATGNIYAGIAGMAAGIIIACFSNSMVLVALSTCAGALLVEFIMRLL